MKKGSIIILVILIVIVFFQCADFFGLFKGEEKIIYIADGTSPSEIYTLLENYGIINSKFLFSLYAKKASPRFTAGYHTFYRHESYKSTVNELLSAGAIGGETQITFPEGIELREIAALLEGKGIKNQDEFIKATNKKFNYDFLPPKKDGYLEGYLFPDTYYITPDMTCEDIINMMLRRFGEIYTDKYKARANELGMTTHEIITLASMIEREAAVDSERKLVSSVFHNRLNSDYKYLESCATVQYILGERKDVLSNADTQIDSPYNTYKYPGLPAGPIASPGKASIEAALYPADTNYYFFVSNGDGTQTFSETYSQHLNSGVNKN